MAGFPTVIAANSKSVSEALTNSAFDGKPPFLVALLRDPEFEKRGKSESSFKTGSKLMRNAF